MYIIEGHEFKQADNANRVALYIGGDVLVGRETIAHECESMNVGDCRTYHQVDWQNADRHQLISVRRTA